MFEVKNPLASRRHCEELPPFAVNEADVGAFPLAATQPAGSGAGSNTAPCSPDTALNEMSDAATRSNVMSPWPVVTWPVSVAFTGDAN